MKIMNLPLAARGIFGLIALAGLNPVFSHADHPRKAPRVLLPGSDSQKCHDHETQLRRAGLACQCEAGQVGVRLDEHLSRLREAAQARLSQDEAQMLSTPECKGSLDQALRPLAAANEKAAQRSTNALETSLRDELKPEKACVSELTLDSVNAASRDYCVNAVCNQDVVAAKRRFFSRRPRPYRHSERVQFLLELERAVYDGEPGFPHGAECWPVIEAAIHAIKTPAPSESGQLPVVAKRKRARVLRGSSQSANPSSLKDPDFLSRERIADLDEFLENPPTIPASIALRAEPSLNVLLEPSSFYSLTVRELKQLLTEEYATRLGGGSRCLVGSLSSQGPLFVDGIQRHPEVLARYREYERKINEYRVFLGLSGFSNERGSVIGSLAILEGQMLPEQFFEIEEESQLVLLKPELFDTTEYDHHKIIIDRFSASSSLTNLKFIFPAGKEFNLSRFVGAMRQSLQVPQGSEPLGFSAPKFFSMVFGDKASNWLMIPVDLGSQAKNSGEFFSFRDFASDHQNLASFLMGVQNLPGTLFSLLSGNWATPGPNQLQPVFVNRADLGSADACAMPQGLIARVRDGSGTARFYFDIGKLVGDTLFTYPLGGAAGALAKKAIGSLAGRVLSELVAKASRITLNSAAARVLGEKVGQWALPAVYSNLKSLSSVSLRTIQEGAKLVLEGVGLTRFRNEAALFVEREILQQMEGRSVQGLIALVKSHEATFADAGIQLTEEVVKEWLKMEPARVAMQLSRAISANQELILGKMAQKLGSEAFSGALGKAVSVGEVEGLQASAWLAGRIGRVTEMAADSAIWGGAVAGSKALGYYRESYWAQKAAGKTDQEASDIAFDEACEKFPGLLAVETVPGQIGRSSAVRSVFARMGERIIPSALGKIYNITENAVMEVVRMGVKASLVYLVNGGSLSKDQEDTLERELVIRLALVGPLAKIPRATIYWLRDAESSPFRGI